MYSTCNLSVASPTNAQVHPLQPTTPVKARLAFIHGFSDHCNAYYTLFPTLSAAGIQVHGLDQRGWGRSVHKPSTDQGNTGPTNTVLADISCFLASIPDTQPSTPLFLMGHSMGGAEVLYYALAKEKHLGHHAVDFAPRHQIRGFLAESPLIGLDPASKPNEFTVLAGKAAAKVLPKFHLKRVLDPKLLCRDVSVQQDYLTDPFAWKKATLEQLAGMLERGRILNNEMKEFEMFLDVKGTIGKGDASSSTPTPMWIGHGDHDGVTSHAASEAFAERVKKMDGGEGVTMKVYHGAFHKLHCEPDGVKEEFARDVIAFILGIVGGGQSGQTGESEAPVETDRAKL